MVEGISSCYDNLGETYRLEDNYTQALEYYFKCEEQARECELNSFCSRYIKISCLLIWNFANTKIL